MKTVLNYIDDLKAKYGSDNKASKAANIDRSTIAGIRINEKMSDETALKIAHALGVDEAEVMLSATVARSHGEVQKVWLRIGENIHYAK